MAKMDKDDGLETPVSQLPRPWRPTEALPLGAGEGRLRHMPGMTVESGLREAGWRRETAGAVSDSRFSSFERLTCLQQLDVLSVSW